MKGSENEGQGWDPWREVILSKRKTAEADGSTLSGFALGNTRRVYRCSITLPKNGIRSVTNSVAPFGPTGEDRDVIVSSGVTMPARATPVLGWANGRNGARGAGAVTGTGLGKNCGA